jgi:hypothetical protein
MHKIAIIVLAGTETHEGLGRVVNAMIAAREFLEGGDTVQLIFDGAGTEWIKELQNTNHKYHSLYQALKANITGACAHCSKAFNVNSEVHEAQIMLMNEFEGHPSFRKLINDGYQIITF